MSRTSGAAFGRGGLRVAPVSYGTAALGNLYTALDDETWRGCVPAAWQAGIRYFDTAPHYGLGLAERRLGESLAGLPRDEYLVSTKVGRLLDPNDAFRGERDDDMFEVPATHTRVRDHSADGVRRSLDESLERLGLDRIDVVYVHDPEEHYEQTLDTTLPTLDQLRREGVIGAYGVGMNEPGLLADFIRSSDLDVVMIAGCLTLLDQSALRHSCRRRRNEASASLPQGCSTRGSSPPMRRRLLRATATSRRPRRPSRRLEGSRTSAGARRHPARSRGTVPAPLPRREDGRPGSGRGRGDTPQRVAARPSRS